MVIDGKTFIKMDDLGGFNPLFSETSIFKKKNTLPETNIAPKNDGFQ